MPSAFFAEDGTRNTPRVAASTLRKAMRRRRGFPSCFGPSLLSGTGYPPPPLCPQNLENKRFKF